MTNMINNGVVHVGIRTSPITKVRVCLVGLDRFARKQQEHPHARAYCRAVQVEDEALENRVEAAGQETEGAGEEQHGHDRAVFGFEALE